ncbi:MULTISPECIES: replication/maintenance protein RepL [Pseudomonas syringae group genomosp. 2]|nr:MULTISPECIES: replication/maintenance protein RepL [Pseudomonas syringae group genomosp. 2]
MSTTINLRKLEYSPLANPLLEPTEVTVKKRYVKTGTSEELVSTSTGEIRQTAAIYTVDERDDASFVKVFAAGVAAAYDLGRTASRVFQLVLQEYERSPMRQGFAESIELAWFNDGLSGRSVDMSEKTFQRGLKELLAKQFLAPRSPSTFWVNPALFFKGDRVKFITEYRRKSTHMNSTLIKANAKSGTQ